MPIASPTMSPQQNSKFPQHCRQTNTHQIGYISASPSTHTSLPTGPLFPSTFESTRNTIKVLDITHLETTLWESNHQHIQNEHWSAIPSNSPHTEKLQLCSVCHICWMLQHHIFLLSSKTIPANFPATIFNLSLLGLLGLYGNMDAFPPSTRPLIHNMSVLSIHQRQGSAHKSAQEIGTHCSCWIHKINICKEHQTNKTFAEHYNKLCKEQCQCITPVQPGLPCASIQTSLGFPWSCGLQLVCSRPIHCHLQKWVGAASWQTLAPT